MFEGKVECPRCGRVWTLPQASPGIYCDCHLTCEDGDLPRDCSVSQYTDNLKLGWPFGMDQGQLDKGENRHRAYGYCSTHEKYTFKEPVWLEVNWKKWYRQKASDVPAKMRELARR